LWTRWANQFANETLRDGEDRLRRRRHVIALIPWSTKRARTSETEETCVVVLIT
jgi:hypothetical protein